MKTNMRTLMAYIYVQGQMWQAEPHEDEKYHVLHTISITITSNHKI